MKSLESKNLKEIKDLIDYRVGELKSWLRASEYNKSLFMLLESEIYIFNQILEKLK